MDRISFIVERLNMPPFSKGLATMADFDSKSSIELLDIVSEIVVAIDPEQEMIMNEPAEMRVHRIIQFLMVMKFNIPEDQMEDFQGLLLSGDHEILHTVLHWCLQRFEHLQKRAYLARFLMPVEIPAEFMGEDLVMDLSQRLKELQADFKEVHKTVDHVRSQGARPGELKNEIAQLEQEKTQLRSKIQKLKRDAENEGANFDEMLKVTSALRKEQEEELRIHDRLREYRRLLQEAENRFNEVNRRLSELRSSGVQGQTAEQLFQKLQKDVKELSERRDSLEAAIVEREVHLEKLSAWDSTDRNATEDDVRMKRDQVRDMEDDVARLSENLEAALERNTKLVVFRQASAMAMKKMREREEEVEKLEEEKRRLKRQLDEKENNLKAQGKLGSGKGGKKDLKSYGAEIQQKIKVYKRMREELSAQRAELVILQRTEQILKSRHKNLDEFLSELERRRGVEGYRDTQRALIEMTEKAAEIDATKGQTLDEISRMVEQINREFKAKKAELEPLMRQLKDVRQEYMDVESQYMERKGSYDKVAVGLEIDKQNLEKECDSIQEECLREESRYHYVNNLAQIARIKLERAEQEKKWLSGQGRMVRDFQSLKDLYANKLAQQEQLTKTLRKKQKDLKENAGVMTNQKTIFNNLQALLDAKIRCEQGSGMGDGMTSGPRGESMAFGSGGGGGANVMSMDYDF